jgi:hypothetical protein
MSIDFNNSGRSSTDFKPAVSRPVKLFPTLIIFGSFIELVIGIAAYFLGMVEETTFFGLTAWLSPLFISCVLFWPSGIYTEFSKHNEPLSENSDEHL